MKELEIALQYNKGYRKCGGNFALRDLKGMYENFCLKNCISNVLMKMMKETTIYWIVANVLELYKVQKYPTFGN